MATDITMPKLSDTMTEGRLIAWQKAVGDRVERGEIIALVETDKATMELESFSSGTLLEIRVKADELVPVGTVIGIVGAAGEEVATGVVRQSRAAVAEPVASATPAATVELVSQAALDLHSHEDREKASPLVRRLAREHGVELSLVHGSGPEGRILQEDLELYIARQSGVAVGIAPLPVEPGVALPRQTAELATAGDTLPLTRMRGAIARRVSEAWRTIPHFSITMAIDMGEAERVRHELKGTGTQTSHNDLLVKATALALAKFPRVNSSFTAEGIVTPAEINIGIAVALEDGLLVPVIKGCQQLSLKEIALASRVLVAKSRQGKLSETELAGGTFTISNLGMFGVEEFTAVIMPPQGAILAVGAIREEPVIRNSHLAMARMMRVTLSADHRLLDGAHAAQFLKELQRILENPVQMLV